MKNKYLSLLPHLLIFAALAGLVSVFVASYVKLENFYYWSDFNYYQWSARTAADVLKQNFLLIPLLVLASMRQEYNLLFTVPLAPILLVLGDSRFAFIEAIALCFMLPMSLALAAICIKLFCQIQDSFKRGVCFWSIVFVQLLLPSTWASVLRGYPDASAEALLCLIVLFFCWRLEGETKSKSWKNELLLGAMLALVVLLRRHFAYDCLAFGLALGLCQIIKSKKNAIAILARRFLLMGLGAITVFLLIGWENLQLMLKHNYSSLYEAFHLSLSENLGYFISSFGLPIMCCALLGWLFAFKRKGLSDFTFNLISGWSIFTPIIWMILAGQLGMHYLLHFQPFIVLGVGSFFWELDYIVKNKALRLATLIAVFGYLILNASFSLGPIKLAEQLPFKVFKPGILSLAEQEGNLPSLLFSANYSPLQRHDETEMKSLIETLRKIAKERKQRNLKTAIYVAATSNVVEGDILKNAERKFYNTTQSTLDIPLVTNVDTRDSYPVEGLIHADVVLVAEPTQLAVPMRYQHVLDSANKCFLQGWDFSRHFHRLEQSFTLDKNVKVSLFERDRPSNFQDAIELLDQCKKELFRYPGGQPDWITTGTASNYRGQRDRKDFTFDMKNSLSPSTMEHYLLYVPVLPKKFKIKGVINSSNTKNLSMGLVCLNEHRKEIGETIIERFKDCQINQFSFEPEVEGTRYLVLKITAEPQERSTCEILVTNLALQNEELE